MKKKEITKYLSKEIKVVAVCRLNKKEKRNIKKMEQFIHARFLEYYSPLDDKISGYTEWFLFPDGFNVEDEFANVVFELKELLK